MQLMILAGGFGSRISEESHLLPKPLIEIGEKPIIWHIMKHYAHFGVKDFIICCGYKGNLIKEYFLNYKTYHSDFSINLRNSSVTIHNSSTEDWTVTLVETGLNSGTAKRIKIASDYLKTEEDFCLAYGDTISNVDISKLIKCHQDQGKWVTVTAGNPPGRFGGLDVSGNSIKSFKEKKDNVETWVSAGFFVINRNALTLITPEHDMWEQEPMEILASGNQLNAYFHEGFWQPMDTLRDKKLLESFWESSNPPWKLWL